MSEMLPKYRIYPSLLDKFGQYLRSDEEVESFWNIDNETGEYKKTAEEIESELKQSLLDSINRVPFDSEAADKGTAFNEVVDCLIHNRKPEPGSKVQLVSNVESNFIQATINDRIFLFDLAWCKAAAEYFKGSVSQLFVCATIETKYGTVELYGFVDELKRDTVFDIKTTSKYDFGKYANGWQRHVYPYCLIESGQMESVKAFEYTAYQLKGGTSRTPLISGTCYPEYYVYNHEQTVKLLRNHCERFIEFLEENRALITDNKIFGGEKS